MKFSRLTWATCPECKILLNDFRLYNLEMVMSSHPFYHPITCPKCKHKFSVRAVTSLEFVTDDSEVKP